MTNVVALIVAAGSGLRLGGELPKQFLPLAGKPLLRHCLETFSALPLLQPALGGETRQASVHNGLESLIDNPPDLVLIHDAARPFLDAPTIDRTIDALQEHDGALVAVQVVDTLKRADG